MIRLNVIECVERWRAFHRLRSKTGPNAASVVVRRLRDLASGCGPCALSAAADCLKALLTDATAQTSAESRLQKTADVLRRTYDCTTDATVFHFVEEALALEKQWLATTWPQDTSNECTGISANWCPVHGECTCPHYDDNPDNGRTLNDESCPLHSSTSSHGEGVALPGFCPERCPTCGSVAPHKHPAVQVGGEVQLCPDLWHSATRLGRKVIARASREAFHDTTRRAADDAFSGQATPAGLPAVAPHQPSGLVRDQLTGAIRAFTVDTDDGRRPNGIAEWWLGQLVDSLAVGDLQAAQNCVEPYLSHSADDTQRLREAAEAFFGGDFRKPHAPSRNRD